MAAESFLAEGEEYVVTLEEGEDVETVLQLEDEQQETIELIVPEAHVECEVSNFSWDRNSLGDYRIFPNKCI